MSERSVETLRRCYEASIFLKKEMSRWLSQSARMDGPGPNGGGEDEANYALAWFQHHLITREEAAARQFRKLLSALKGWVERECVDGYEPKAEAHHGTEPFLLFLPRYIDLFPEDESAQRLLLGAAQHIGNWHPESPDWFDDRRGCFRSFHLGTRHVGSDPRYAYEFTDHIRFLHIALAAYRASGQQRYADWAVKYGRVWAKRIAACDTIPVVWTQMGEPVAAESLDPQTRRAAAGHHIPNDPLGGVENLLASGAVYAFGDLFSLNREPLFAQAANRIASQLISTLNDPFADPGAAALCYTRQAFGDRSLDAALLEEIARFPKEPPRPLAMLFPEERKRREPGVGKRSDMIYWAEWREDGSARPLQAPTTAAYALAYQMTREPIYARLALETAGRKLAMARRVLRGGREHADMGGAVCSVAAGHGRNWGCGAVTGCYGPLLLGTREILGAVTPRYEFAGGRVPDGLLPLASDGAVLFYNGSKKRLDIEWRQLGKSGWEKWTLQPSESAERILE